MSSGYLKGVPGVSRAALDAISDENTRIVLSSMVDGWEVRNGTAGDKDGRFITAAEYTGTVASFKQSINSLTQAIKNVTSVSSTNLSGLASGLLSQIIESQLFKDLQERVDSIDTNLTAETANRVSAIAAEASARLGTDAAQGSLIAALEETTDTQATLISGLSTRIGSAESVITNLETTTSSQATSLSNLLTRVGTAESNIGTLQTTTSNQATSISTISTQVSDVQTGLLGAQTDIAAAEAAIISEATTRANEDNAIATLVATQYATVNGTLAAIQSSQTTTANAVAALTSTVTTLQATVGDNTVAVAQEALARANADNQLYAQYTLKLDINGYVAGFGLASESNQAGDVTSAFIIRADKFALVMPGYNDYIPFAIGDLGIDFNGNVSGKVDGVPAGTVRLNAEQAIGIAEAAQAAADYAEAIVADLSSDSKLTPVEKQQIKVEWDGIVNTYNQINNQAAYFGVGSKTAHTAAFNDLFSYITPLLGDLTTTSNIDGPTFRGKFSTYYAQRQNVLTQISSSASQMAIWSGVSGYGRPQDFATLGAQVGVDLKKPNGSTTTAADFIASWNKLSTSNIATFMDTAVISNAFIGSAAVGTLNLAGNSVTVQAQGSSGSGSATASVYLPYGGSAFVIGQVYAQGGSGATSMTAYIVCSNGQTSMNIGTRLVNDSAGPADGGIVVSAIFNLSAGSHSFTLYSACPNRTSFTSNIAVFASQR